MLIKILKIDLKSGTELVKYFVWVLIQKPDFKTFLSMIV